MPFAACGATLGYLESKNQITTRLIIGLIICMVTARNAAMAFNRLVDVQFDQKNPRTANRELPKQLLSLNQVKWFILINCVLFVLASYVLNPLCFYLSPLALLIILGYSFTKRFTWFCHLFLGLSLGLAPVGGYIAMTGHLNWIPVLMGILVTVWVAGFDILYATQDMEFDRKEKLYSIPARFGIHIAFWCTRGLHLVAAACVIILYFTVKYQNPSSNTYIFGMGSLGFIILLLYQNSIVSPENQSRINRAFFFSNGLASLLYGISFVISVVFF